MRSFHNRPFRFAASYLGISLLAAGSLAAGQSNLPQEQGAHASSPQVASSGGWKRVGGSPDQAPPTIGTEANPPGQSGSVTPPAPPAQPMNQQPGPPAGSVQNPGPQPYGQ